ncbi:MAG: DUF1460 domain-containing protein [Bacteroidales bacterium]|jgi:hypothetical protein|nr:DUF1460 domain-containing protein [Bacteroidales bacterium]HPH53901.1 DUF1460 domain-containing protein [Bacteroidales bacterium]
MRYILSLLVLLCTLTTSCSQPQVRYTPEDKASYERLLERMLPHRAQPLDQLVIMTALHKLGTPYVAGTLEQDPEMLTVCMNKTDCILFVEMCLAFSLTLKEENPDFDSYCDNLLKLRYRNGIVEDYSSRIHYTSEWIRQATERGIMEEITAEIGGIIWPQEFSFMSTHTDSYRQLRENPSLVEKIRTAEEYLNAFEYYYIPKNEIAACEHLIYDGDIICFNSTAKGLDIAHVGYAYWQGDQLTFIHASSVEMEVVINKKPLTEYISGIKTNNGIRVVRLK